MPSREEIASWLREAEAALNDYESLLEGIGRRIASHDIQCLHEDFADRAAQVEAMRCETCNYYELYSPFLGKTGKCAKFDRLRPPDFCCFDHEQKPAD